MSKRAGAVVLVLGAGLLGLYAYGGIKRQQRQAQTIAEAGGPANVAPATPAAAEIANQIPSGDAVTVAGNSAGGALVPPQERAIKRPAAGQVITVRHPVATALPGTTAAIQQPREPTPEERQLAAAWEQEQRALVAPTSAGGGSAGPGFGDSFAVGGAPGAPAAVSQPSETPLLAELLQKLRTADVPAGPAPSRPTVEYSEQNMQSVKEAFLSKARSASAEDYLRSTRTAPLSQYEIKAGWEIPAVLEQALDSDLPGEIKALVTSNVYDTATGRYVLIPQGARLVGIYDSHLGYGQDGVQVVWNRIIYPDGSSIDLNGMQGLDAHGNSGLRHSVDRHYKRLLGFAVLTSLFGAAFDVSQARNQSILTYPSPSEVAGQAVGRDLSELGAQVTRRNLNVQPTVKVPAGYKFTVRVNRDILFDGPYQALYEPSGSKPMPMLTADPPRGL